MARTTSSPLKSIATILILHVAFLEFASAVNGSNQEQQSPPKGQDSYWNLDMATALVPYGNDKLSVFEHRRIPGRLVHTKTFTSFACTSLLLLSVIIVMLPN